MSEILIVQRQTLDWESLDLASFRTASRDFCRRLGKPDDFVFRLASLWNDCFGCSYFETRARIKAISEAHNRQIAGTRFQAYTPDRSISLDEAGYVFIDDDDWFSPELGSALAPVTGDDNFLLWRCTNIGSPNQAQPVFFWGLNGRCMTNNYMAAGHWVRRQGSLEGAYWHKDAIRSIEAEPSVDQLDRCLSVANKGPVSSMSLIRGLGGSREPEALIALIEKYLHHMDSVGSGDLAHIPWAEPLLRETIDVYRDVQASRR